MKLYVAEDFRSSDGRRIGIYETRADAVAAIENDFSETLSKDLGKSLQLDTYENVPEGLDPDELDDYLNKTEPNASEDLYDLRVEFYRPVREDGAIYAEDEPFDRGSYHTAREVVSAMRAIGGDIIADIYSPETRVASYAIIEGDLDTWFDAQSQTGGYEWTNPAPMSQLINW